VLISARLPILQATETNTKKKIVMTKIETKEEGLRFVREALAKAQVADDVKGKVIAVFVVSTSPWWFAPPEYIEYLISQLITLFTYKFEDERMSIPANMVYLMAADKGMPSILLHWRVYLSLYAPYVKSWKLETIKDNEGKPIGMVAVIIDKDGEEWRWERYYDNLQLTSRWKNKELMFAKTILKEALAIKFPHLNLLPPLSTVETYDPDDLDDPNRVSVTSVASIMSAPVSPPPPAPANNGQRVAYPTEKAPNPNPNNQQKSSPEIVKRLADAPPPDNKKEKMGDADINREVQDKYKELGELVGDGEALNIMKGIVSHLGAPRFADLDIHKKRVALSMLNSAIIAEKNKRQAKYG
jgi:hypothetical protein